jgi:hypothetical protein
MTEKSFIFGGLLRDYDLWPQASDSDKRKRQKLMDMGRILYLQSVASSKIVRLDRYGVTLNRGQVLTSIGRLAGAWGETEATVRAFIKRMERLGKIAVDGHRRNSPPYSAVEYSNGRREYEGNQGFTVLTLKIYDIRENAPSTTPSTTPPGTEDTALPEP